MEKLMEHPLTNVNTDMILRELRYRIYKLTKHHIHEKHEEHECSADVVRNLKSLCNICSDHVDQAICFSEYSKVFTGSHKYLEVLSKLTKVPVIGGWATRKLSNSIFWEYQFFDVLISCSKEITQEIMHMPMKVDYKLQVEQITEEIEVEIAKLIGQEESLIIQFNSLVGFIRTKQAAYKLLQFQRKQVQHFEHLGMVSEGEREAWIAKLDKKIVDVKRYMPSKEEVEIGDINAFTLEYPMFSILSNKELDFVNEAKNIKDFKKNGNILF
jgi:hypothetical protein